MSQQGKIQWIDPGAADNPRRPAASGGGPVSDSGAPSAGATASGFRPASLDAVNFLAADRRGAVGPARAIDYDRARDLGPAADAASSAPFSGRL
jgi:hypothetical protein